MFLLLLRMNIYLEQVVLFLQLGLSLLEYMYFVKQPFFHNSDFRANFNRKTEKSDEPHSHSLQ